MSQNSSVFDQLSKGIADAVRDIREKVVEEPWYGRAVTQPEAEAPQWPQAQETEQSFGSSLRTRESMEQNRDAVEQDIDR